MEKMYSREYFAAIEEAMKKEAILEALAKAVSKDDVIRIFADNGIEMDEDLAADIYTKLYAGDELDEDVLDGVNGGFMTILGGAAMIGAGALTFYVTVKVGSWIVRKIT